DEVVPVPVVPPFPVARAEPVVGRSAVGLDAVYEVEPVPSRRAVAAEAVDRLDEAATVGRVDPGRAPERIEGRLARRGTRPVDAAPAEITGDGDRHRGRAGGR